MSRKPTVSDEKATARRARYRQKQREAAKAARAAAGPRLFGEGVTYNQLSGREKGLHAQRVIRAKRAAARAAIRAANADRRVAHRGLWKPGLYVPSTSPGVSWADLGMRVAQTLGIPYAQGHMLVLLFCQCIMQGVRRDGEVRLPGFGVFYLGRQAVSQPTGITLTRSTTHMPPELARATFAQLRSMNRATPRKLVKMPRFRPFAALKAAINAE